jgi:hypothetical protein
MSPSERLVFIFAFVAILAIAYAVVYRKDLLRHSFFLDKKLLERGMDKPVIWLYYNDSDVHSRNWLDFGNRSSRAIQIPYLNVLYQRIVELNKDHYRVEVIAGLSGLAELLGSDSLPASLQQPLASVNEAELNWIRTAVLARFGGLWLDPAVICIKGFGKPHSEKVVFYGTDENESYAGQKGTLVPGQHAMWVPKPQHPMMMEWEAVCRDRLEHKRGGEQIRRDYAWDYVRFSEQYKSLGIVVDPHAEGSRTAQGKRIQLEDLLGATVNGKIPFTFAAESAVVYVPIPYHELIISKNYQWFLRSSEKQIMESDLAVTALLSQ